MLPVDFPLFRLPDEHLVRTSAVHGMDVDWMSQVARHNRVVVAQAARLPISRVSVFVCPGQVISLCDTLRVQEDVCHRGAGKIQEGFQNGDAGDNDAQMGLALCQNLEADTVVEGVLGAKQLTEHDQPGNCRSNDPAKINKGIWIKCC